MKILVTRYILDLETEESKAVLDLLFNHITTSQDIQCRVEWKKGTVVVWDVSADVPNTFYILISSLQRLTETSETSRTASLHTQASLISLMVKFVIWHV